MILTPSDIAADLAVDLRSGTPTRRTIDTRAITAGSAFPATVAHYIEPLSVTGTSFTVARVAASETPVAIVGEGAAKPTAGSVTVATVK
jgi:hypothetical protein